MRAPMVHVEHGYVIVRSDGRMVDDFLYCGREIAESITTELFADCRVVPARKISSFQRATTTTLKLRTDIIVDREAS